MPKPPAKPQPLPPTITKSDGRRRFEMLIERGRALLAKPRLVAGDEDVWSTSGLEAVKATFGEASGYISNFIGSMGVRVVYGDEYDEYLESDDRRRIQRRCDVLKSFVDLIEAEAGYEAPPPPAPSFWADLHPQITKIAQARFEAGHFADAVEAAFKEINALVKVHHKRKTGAEDDGASLMNKAFSPNGPSVVLADLSTESGKSEQLGYMQIFAGAMTGIRNPKAHANMSITEDRAKHLLFLASLLLHRFDERL